MESKHIEFCGEIREETDKAFCVFDGVERTWIPKSVIFERRKVDRRNSVLTIPERVAKLKGII
jgi:hypothetical protein